MPKPQQEKDASYAFGVLVSLVVHLICAALALFSLESSAANASRAPEVFTVTLEGGEKLGGFSQVPSKPEKEVKPPSPLTTPQVEETSAGEPEVKKEAPKKKLEAPSVVDDPEKKIKEAKLKEEAKKKEQKKQAEEAKKKVQEAKEKAAEAKKKAEETKKREAEAAKKQAAEEAKRQAENERIAAEREMKRKAQARIDRNKRLAAISNKMKSKETYEGESANVGGEGFGAAKLGGKGMGGGTLASAEKVAYANALQEHVKSGWRWLTGKDRLQALVMVRILPDGTISDVKIAKSSGNSNFDDSVVRAVRKANPAPAPPTKFYRDFSAVRFVFDSHER